ncbi:MAG: methyltransferase [Woeseiaceae bacterium]
MLTDKELKKIREDIVFSETLKDIPFVFHSTWGVFSPRSIDDGTKMLLKYLEIKETDDCLDLGCGYGPLGLTMAKLAPKGTTTLVDKDFKAVEYSNINAELNQITNAEALLSNGFDQISKRKFNVIVSNIPAKVGNEMLTLFLHDAFKQMKHGGKIYVVTITGLRKYIKRNFEDVFGNYKKLKQGPSYTVAMAIKE